MNNDLGTKMASVIARCWTDPEFKQRFLKEPKSVIAEAVLDLPPEAELVIVEDTMEKRHFVLPAIPPEGFTTEALGAAVERAIGIPRYCRADEEGAIEPAAAVPGLYCVGETESIAVPGYCVGENESGT